MRAIPAHIQDVIATDALTLVTCWRITLVDGSVLRFTDHEDDIVIGAERFSCEGEFSRTAIKTSLGLAEDNLDVIGSIGSDSITEADLIAGKYSFADVEIFLVDYLSPNSGDVELCAGRLGEIGADDGKFSATMYGLASQFQQAEVELCSPTCRANIGDSRCKVDMSAFTWAGTVTALVDSQTFNTNVVLALNILGGGLITFTSGANQGIPLEVKANGLFGTGLTALFLPAPYPVAVGNTFTVSRGCDGTPTTCRDVYHNIINFQGEPFTPGSDKILQVNNAKPSDVV